MRILYSPSDQEGSPIEVTRGRASVGDDVVVPPIDLYETDEGWVLLADVPGASKDDLALEVDKGVLTIHARVAKPEQEGRAIHEEFERGDYFRSFPLSDQVDRTRITANITCGVLTVVLPKAEEARSRKIVVEAGD